MLEENFVFDFMGLATQLFDLPRSISNQDLDLTFEVCSNFVPLKKKSFAIAADSSWPDPLRWKLYSGNVSLNGEKVIDSNNNPLHVISHSAQINRTINFQELKEHLHYNPLVPDHIPYVSTYYKKDWGFAISQTDYEKLPIDANYEVNIKSDLYKHPVEYFEYVIQGESTKEIIFSTYYCHPNLANDNLSGLIVNLALAKWLMDYSKLNNLHFTYRFLFLPETIGAVRYIEEHKNELKSNVVAGWILTCLGYGEEWSYLQSRYGGTLSDKVTLQVAKKEKISLKTFSYLERGSDERQFCWPGTDLPFSSIMRSKYNNYQFYHTSGDNLSILKEETFKESFNFYLKIVKYLEENKLYNVCSYTEPFLSDKGFYPSISDYNTRAKVKDVMNILAYCDGTNFISDLSRIVNLEENYISSICSQLLVEGLICRV